MSDTTPSPGRATVAALFAATQDKLAILAEVDPILLDVSLREPCFDSYLGHTLQNKLDLLPLVDGFGIRDKVIATLDYQFEDFPQVEDDFCRYLNESGYDMTGCFALTAVGKFVNDKFVPDHSMLKLRSYQIPNTMNEIYLLPEKLPRQQVLDTLTASVNWLRQNISGDHGGPCRIYLNVVDLIDTFFADQNWACQVLEHLATLPIDALSFEDARGTFFPFQVGATVAAAKALLRPQQKVLFHCHAGNGMDNASVIEGLLQGADGYWAGMDRESSTIGHAAISELIANLMRAGNHNMAQRYQVKTLLPITHLMHRINTEQETPATWPIQGANAYRQMLRGFDQTATRFMDLPPEAIGNQPYTFRISPVGSDIAVVRGRVLEQLDLGITCAVAKQMILLMRSDLRQGTRLRYDDHDALQVLHERAIGVR